MSKTTLKSIAKRGITLGAGFALVAASFVPMVPASADALNPLTDRSLTLSSSSPGWAYTDGSGNTTYAPPNSGANGQKTGNTFDFKVSTDTSETGTDEPVKAMTFQYCTTPAGNCLAPGNNGFTGSAPTAERKDDSPTTSDLNIVTSSPSELSPGEFGTYIDTATGMSQAIPAPGVTGKNFVVYYDAANDGTWVQSTGWEMVASNDETFAEEDAKATGKKNFITLSNEEGGLGVPHDARVKVVFFATDSNYITNPGAGEFFVKINTYKDDITLTEINLVDGGVTVANVMNQSIQITTKVLETMDFSVGTVDPNTLDSTDGVGSQLHIANGHESHGICDRILTRMTSSDPANVLRMGNEDGEFSLKTDTTYSTHSYWRLSSNSSAGATVYYSGVTLSNTVDDEIEAIGPNSAAPLPGQEQFGLALANGSGPNYLVDYGTERDEGFVFEWGADNATDGVHTESMTEDDVIGNPSYHTPQLAPLAPLADYANGAGVVNKDYAGTPQAIDTAFAFDVTSQLVPVAMATEDDQVVDCVTAKVRYIANIAATTPAGIYTTKINYIAAPQY